MVFCGSLEPTNLLFHDPLGGEVSPEKELTNIFTLLCAVVLKQESEGEVTTACRGYQGRGLDALDTGDTRVTVDCESLHELLIILGQRNVI